LRLATTAGYEAATAPRAASDLFGGTPPEANAPVEVAENETSATAMAMAKNGFVIIEKKNTSGTTAFCVSRRSDRQEVAALSAANGKNEQKTLGTIQEGVFFSLSVAHRKIQRREINDVIV
jgi:hypothetical protein